MGSLLGYNCLYGPTEESNGPNGPCNGHRATLQMSISDQRPSRPQTSACLYQSPRGSPLCQDD